MPQPQIPPDKKRRLSLAWKKPGATCRGVADECAVSIGTAQNYKPKDLFKPKVDPVKQAEERRESARLLNLEREALQAVAGERSFRSFLANLIRETTPTLDAPPRYREPKKRGAAVDESLLLILSDWHAYERVESEQVYGLNEYNADVMGRRVWRVVSSVRSIADKMRAGGWRFPRLTVAANGDFISGTIHEVEKHSDAPDVMRAAIGCGLLLAESLRDLAASFEAVEVFGVSGNHGRLPDRRKVHQKEPARNWDYLIYTIAEIALRDVKAVKFYLPNSYSAVYELEGWRFAQNHGHDIRQWNQIPFYGINRQVTGLNALLTARGQPIHYFLYSHFHNPGSIASPGGEYFVNGSLIGGTEFSVNSMGRADRPCQWLLGVHRDHGVTHRWPVYAEGPTVSGEANGSYNVKPWNKAA